ncbi:hypothetical protein CRE_08361 [Caenorhabditis remanei]|uniref:Uncharacterized protein n=1 Tax=Caenorhabditis remanei TaxID=31234 RepID=E3MPM6_CAERE|nr:hypothetical protein CRE_08361 [Caenorhabditis remanei]
MAVMSPQLERNDKESTAATNGEEFGNSSSWRPNNSVTMHEDPAAIRRDSIAQSNRTKGTYTSEETFNTGKHDVATTNVINRMDLVMPRRDDNLHQQEEADTSRNNVQVESRVDASRLRDVNVVDRIPFLNDSVDDQSRSENDEANVIRERYVNVIDSISLSKNFAKDQSSRFIGTDTPSLPDFPEQRGNHSPATVTSTVNLMEKDIKREQAKLTSIKSALTVMTPFSGDICDYPAFIGLFDFMVHNNDYLDFEIKQGLLMKLLPKDLVDVHQTTPSKENYWTIRRNMERQFNSPGVQKIIAWRKSMELEFPEHDLSGLTSALNTFSTLANKQKAYGTNPDDPNFLISFARRLPERFSRIAHSLLLQNIAATKLDQLLDALHEELAIQQWPISEPSRGNDNGIRQTNSTQAKGDDGNHYQQCHQERPKHESSHHQHKKSGNRRKPPSKLIPCQYCDDKDHCALQCKASLRKKKEAVKDKLLCNNCLSSTHMVTSCRSKNNCSNCKIRHFTGHCESTKPDGYSM